MSAALAQPEPRAVRPLPLSVIRLDGGTQPRESKFDQTIEQYVEDMIDGAIFPPLIVFYDGTDYWLADGFHRWHAATGCKYETFPCEVRQGTQRDAVLFSVGANATHGRPRTNADKKRAVTRLLDDPEWSLWSDREIARRCYVSTDMVSRLRPEPSVAERQIDEPRTVQRGGATYTMKTAGQRRGRKVGAQEAAVEPETPMAEVVDIASAREEAAPEPEVAEPFEDPYLEQLPNADALFDILETIERLPDPETVARTFPLSYRTSFTPDTARRLAAWFGKFSEAMHKHRGGRHAA